jgi:hypothetical protein
MHLVQMQVRNSFSFAVIFAKQHPVEYHHFLVHPSKLRMSLQMPLTYASTNDT